MADIHPDLAAAIGTVRHKSPVADSTVSGSAYFTIRCGRVRTVGGAVIAGRAYL